MAPKAKALIDRFGRQVNYLRVSVTDRCNLRCTYCMAEKMTFLPKDEILTMEEIHQISKAFVELGVRKIRITGGEPLVRKGIIELLTSLSALPELEELVLSSNAVLLTEMASEVKKAGVQRINISLDTLNAERFKTMSRVGGLDQVLQGIDAANNAGFESVKLNAVIMAGINDDEVIDLARFALDRHMDISFIEEMPLGEITSHQRASTQISSEVIKNRLKEVFDLQAIAPKEGTTNGPSRYMREAKSGQRIGFISPISNNFCSSCNRVRLTVQGRLLLCLGNEHSLDLRDVVRNKPEQLHSAIEQSLALKPEKHHFDPSEIKHIRFMSMTGG